MHYRETEDNFWSDTRFAASAHSPIPPQLATKAPCLRSVFPPHDGGSTRSNDASFRQHYDERDVGTTHRPIIGDIPSIRQNPLR
jgi:hypothetical protein